MLVMGTTKRPAHPVGEFVRAQHSIELHDLALAMNPFGLDGVLGTDSASAEGN